MGYSTKNPWRNIIQLGRREFVADMTVLGVRHRSPSFSSLEAAQKYRDELRVDAKVNPEKILAYMQDVKEMQRIVKEKLTEKN